ncbi:MAG: 3'(2'),5'-bisphosphate nucleotidase CysQ [Chitinivibrionales bacterium]|nr:3'(2'),5'-bisphosphate nucleotidase CysQ [Chitinivibrionales bacterium]
MERNLATQAGWIATAATAARRAGAAILEVYGTEFTVEQKEDRSPLTEADKRSTGIIERCLAGTGLPILSEEGRQTPYDERSGWEWYWLVDPLDGTKEFVKRNGEFTVNIALMHADTAVGGLVYVPVTGTLYVAMAGLGAYRKLVPPADDAGPCTWESLTDGAERLPMPLGDRSFTAVASRSHMSPETEAYVEKLRERSGDVALVSRGSSLKLCLLAEGAADIYPRFAPTMEWDTAAGHAIVKEAGGNVYRVNETDELVYNKPDLVNPWFVAKRCVQEES